MHGRKLWHTIGWLQLDVHTYVRISLRAKTSATHIQLSKIQCYNNKKPNKVRLNGNMFKVGTDVSKWVVVGSGWLQDEEKQNEKSWW